MDGVSSQDRIRNIFYYGLVFLLLYLVYRIAQPFLAPLGWAGVLVVCFYPIHARIEKRAGPTRGALLSTLIVTALLIVPAISILTAFVNEGLSAVREADAAQGGRASAQHTVQDAWEWIRGHSPVPLEEDLGTALKQLLQRVGGFLAARAGAVAKNAAVFMFDLVVVIFALFFFFRDNQQILAAIRGILPFDSQQRDDLMRETRELINASVNASLVIAAIQGLLGGILFAALGISAPVFWGVIMAFFSLLPMVGSWLVWGPAAIYLFVTGEIVRGIILVAISAGVISTVDNVLRPMLLSGRTQLNSLLVFIGVLGGVGVFGMLGLILGPIVLAAAISVLKAYVHRDEPAPDPVQVQ